MSHPFRALVISSIALLLILADAGAVRASAASQAGLLDVTCAGTQSIRNEPGLTFTPRLTTVTARTIYAPCVSLPEPAVTSGLTVVSNSGIRSCLDLTHGGSGTRVITWNTGDTSTFTYTRTVNGVAGNQVTTLTGAITSGLFAGSTAVQVNTSPNADLLDCATAEGLTTQVSAVTLEITAL